MEGQGDLNVAEEDRQFTTRCGCLVMPPLERVRELSVTLDRVEGVEGVGVSMHPLKPTSRSAIDQIAGECSQRCHNGNNDGQVVLHACSIDVPRTVWKLFVSTETISTRMHTGLLGSRDTRPWTDDLFVPNAITCNGT